jgi:hypothetical protein
MDAINRAMEQQNGERAVVEALAQELRMTPQSIVQERQQLQTGYGQYARLILDAVHSIGSLLNTNVAARGPISQRITASG